jgi:hypothetical protein
MVACRIVFMDLDNEHFGGPIEVSTVRGVDLAV